MPMHELVASIARHLPNEVRVIMMRCGNEIKVPVTRTQSPSYTIHVRNRFSFTYFLGEVEDQILANVIMASIPNPDLSIRNNLVIALTANTDENGVACELRWGYAYEVPPQQ